MKKGGNETENIVLVGTQETTAQNFNQQSFLVNINGTSSSGGEPGFTLSHGVDASQFQTSPCHFTLRSSEIAEIEKKPASTSTVATVGKPAPHWRASAVINGHVTSLDLNDYKGRYLIMLFYPHDFCKTSSGEVNKLSDMSSELRALTTEVVVCSVDSHASHLAWSKMPRLPDPAAGVCGSKIAILSDPTHSISQSYNVYNSEKGHSLRGLFIIDRKGIIRHMSVHDTGIGRSTVEIMRVLKAIQYADKTPETCITNWIPT